jgi:hypothetical protein
VESNAGVRFDGETDPPRLVVTDTVGGRQYVLRTDGPVDPTPVDPDDPVPVEQAVRIETGRLVASKSYHVHVRTDEGESVETVEYGD